MGVRSTLRLPLAQGRAIVVALLTGALLLSGSTWPASAAVGVPVTFPGHAYSTAVANASEDKPQSKLWYHDGSWWALMVEASGTAVRIHKLDRTTHVWNSTGVLVDSRLNSTADALWSSRDQRLYVASRASGSNLLINAFTYDATRDAWGPVPNFPVTVNSGGGSESATIDQDSLGHLWVTYTRGSRLWVAHSTDAAHVSWTAGFQPNVPDTVLTSDDLSAVIAFGSSMGLMWSDQQSGAVRFAVRSDGAPDSAPWAVEDVSALTGLADDHINLKQLTTDPQGRIFAAIKTSADEVAGSSPNDTLVGVLTRTPGASGAAARWDLAPAGTLAQGWTRPMIMIDSANQELYFFATTGVGGPDIVYKKSPLSQISFPAGAGQPFVDATFSVNNASGAKDPVDATSDLVILASSGGQDRYAHAEMELAGGGDPADPAPTATLSPASGASGVNVTQNVTATFSEDVTGVSGATFTLRASGATSDVAATVSYNASTRVATLDPGASLTAGTLYTATLSPAIQDSAGQSLSPNPTTWSFTTATAQPGTPPQVTARTPAPGATTIGVATNVTATFNEPVTGVGPATFTLTNLATGAGVPAVVSRSGTTNRWILNPNANLAPDTRYRATLTTGIQDAQGTALAATDTWEFVTGPAPRLSSRTPAVGATGVRRSANITATFSEPVTEVTNETFTVRIGTGAAVTATVIRNGSTNQWILDPGVTLAANTRYTVTVTGGASGVRDVAGNPLATVTWTFTTGAT